MASVWDFKRSLSHTERGSDTGGLAHDLDLISSLDIFLVFALAVLWKCLTKSQAVLMICGQVYNADLTLFSPHKICFPTELLNRELWHSGNLSFEAHVQPENAKLHTTCLLFSHNTTTLIFFIDGFIVVALKGWKSKFTDSND